MSKGKAPLKPTAGLKWGTRAAFQEALVQLLFARGMIFDVVLEAVGGVAEGVAFSQGHHSRR